MKKIAWLSVIIMILSLIACGGGGGSDDPNAECSKNWKNGYVYELLQDTYLWYDRVEKNVDCTAYYSPKTLLEAVTPPIDKWSYISTAEEFYDYSEEGKFHGMGCSVAFDRNKNLMVRFVYQGSPADDAGIKRSDEISTINGRLAFSFSDLDAVWDEIYRYDTAEVEVITQNRLTRTETMASDWVTINTVLHREVIDIGDRKVGYLVFKTFIEPAEAELDAAFGYFKQEGIDDLILDLRYNGGGRGSIAIHLASLIAGENVNGELFVKHLHNDKYSQYDKSYPFTFPSNALGLDRVLVISTEDTCSASEEVINGLKPYIQVIQVGETTCGKPVGMYAHDFCDLVIVPIEFMTANANDETNYFDGLEPTCPAMDDITRKFGDREEDALMTALYYIANDACPAVTATVRTMLAEEPLHINELKGLRREIGAF